MQTSECTPMVTDEEAAVGPPHPATMRDVLCVLVCAVAALFSVFFFIKENPFDTTSFLSLEEKELVAWQRARMQFKPGRTRHLQTFQDMQKNSEPLQNANSYVLIGTPPRKKKLLTIGISSGQRTEGSKLVATLRSLFSASSSSERKHLTVLVHLAGPDPRWLVQMIDDLSSAFRPHLQAGELVVITTPLTSYLPWKDPDVTFPDPPGHAAAAAHSRQNMDSAFLMNFATRHSDYFLMVEDAVRCAPGFVTQVVTAASAWAHRPWLTLEFSPPALTGKLFRTGDLPRLVRFLLLFYRDLPGSCLLSHFQDLMEHTPIEFLPSLFRRAGDSSSSFEEGDDAGPPSNPAAAVHTSLKAANGSEPSQAYSLNETFFHTEPAEPGSHLTVVLDVAALVSRVQVLTGSDPGGRDRLGEGQVELGCDATNRVLDCDDYTLLGLVADGTLDQRVLSPRPGKKVKCVRLLVTAAAPSGIVVRHIRLWTTPGLRDQWRSHQQQFGERSDRRLGSTEVRPTRH